jgi:cytochrome c2
MKKIHERDSSEISKRDLLTKYENAMSDGEMIFKNNCAGCHCSTLGTCEPSDMPHLRNLFNRIPQDSINYIVEYIKDSKKLKDRGDKFALQTEQSYPSDFEHDYKNKLAESEAKNVILYLWLPCQRQ